MKIKRHAHKRHQVNRRGSRHICDSHQAAVSGSGLAADSSKLQTFSAPASMQESAVKVLKDIAASLESNKAQLDSSIGRLREITDLVGKALELKSGQERPAYVQ